MKNFSNGLFLGIIIIVLIGSCQNKSKKSGTNQTASDTDRQIFIKDSLENLDSLRERIEEDSLPGEEHLTTADSLTNDKQDDSIKRDPVKTDLWPVKTPPLLPGALLPKHRIIAYYGNLYSKRMGILGEYHPDTVLNKLKNIVYEWQRADSSKKVIPALELITVSGQNVPTRDSLYRMRMPDWMIDSVINMAQTIDALVILDIQVGWSTVRKEIPQFEKYLKMPNVHLAVDPEFYMKEKKIPGTKIGTMDATDINYCITYLRNLVEEHDLPPKLLVIHRFTQGMVTNYKNIELQSQVQVIMDMDGFGSQTLKRDSYRRYIYREPVEYTGIKLFYKNDNRNGHKIMSPADVLSLYPQPVYIQYQ